MSTIGALRGSVCGPILNKSLNYASEDLQVSNKVAYKQQSDIHCSVNLLKLDLDQYFFHICKDVELQEGTSYQNVPVQ